MSAWSKFGCSPGWCAAVALLCIAVAGCAPVNLRGEGFEDASANWGEHLRPTGPPGDVWGTSTRAQQIEQNLGVR